MLRKLIKYTIAWALVLTVSIAGFWYYTQAPYSVSLEYAINDAELLRGHWGIVIQDLDTGETLIRQNEEKNFIPASITKLFTTAASLYILGSDHQFKTQVFTDRKPDGKGVIRGTVTLKGSGDPMLTSESLNLLAKQIKARGVSLIEGKIEIAGFMFDDATLLPHTEWEDLTWGYAPEIHAVSLSDNAIEMAISPAPDQGSPAIIELDESVSYCTVFNLTQTVAPQGKETEASLAIERGLVDNRFTVTGSIPLGHSTLVEKVALHNPSEYARCVFIKHLKENGIDYRITPTKKRVRPNNYELASIDSPPLENIIEKMNKTSNNLIAELLIQTASYRVDTDPSPSSIQTGKAAFRILSHALNLDDPSFSLHGGAGISRQNAVKPVHIIKLLQAMHNSEFRQPFRRSLPIAGIDGTLSDRFKGTICENNVVSKTGTLTGVSTLAGYATTKSGKNVCFCFIVNHHSSKTPFCQDQMDKVLVSLLESL